MAWRSYLGACLGVSLLGCSDVHESGRDTDAPVGDAAMGDGAVTDAAPVCVDAAPARTCSGSGEAGAPGIITIASGEDNPYGIAVDCDYVYWSSGSANIIRRAPLAGGTPETLPILNPDIPLNLARDGEYLYWIGNQTIYRLSMAGGDPEVVVSGPNRPISFAIRGGWLAYTAGYPVGASGVTSLTCGGSRTFASMEEAPDGVTLDDTFIYWVDWQSNLVRKAPLDGSGPPVTLASGQGRPNAIAVDETHVYWTNGDGGLMTLDKAGSGTPVQIAGGQVSGLILDAGTLFWIDNMGAVMKAQTSGAGLTALASNESGLYNLAVDASFVYWVANGASAIRKTLR